MKKIALVIGGSSGIGYETIKLLLENNCLVYNASRRNCNLEKVINYEVDVSNKESIIKCIEEIKVNHKTIDYVIYSAGFSMASYFENTLEKDYRYLFEVNFFGAIEFLKRILPIMKENNSGKFIVVSSVASDEMIPFDPFYNSSKSALNAVVKNINFEFNQYNVYITSILPGGTKTNFTYKRKINSENNESFNNILSNLEDFEQNGESPKKVAQLILKTLYEKKPKPIIISGFKNKLEYHLLKTMPIKLSQAIIYKKFNVKNE